MGILDFTKKKKAEEALSPVEDLKNPFTSLKGEDLTNPQDVQSIEQEIPAPQKPADFDLMNEPLFKTNNLLEEDITELQSNLKGVIEQLSLAVNKLDEIKERVKK
ncbi:MAG: hypothetical protein JW791_04800 [Nanoarchaeota archaeon]|nr:hypothetical protein [Nanoarchaeota archaeon]